MRSWVGTWWLRYRRMMWFRILLDSGGLGSIVGFGWGWGGFLGGWRSNGCFLCVLRKIFFWFLLVVGGGYVRWLGLGAFLLGGV